MKKPDSANAPTTTQPSPHRPSTFGIRHSSFSTPWLFFLLFALFGAGLYFGGLPDLSLSASPAPSAVNPVTAATDAPRYVTKEIRDIRIFDWVLARNPELSAADRAEFPEIEPDDWRLVTLQMPKQDGSRLDISLARPVEWFEANRAAPGATIDLDLPEMGAEGPADVRSVRPCPAPDPKPDPLCRLVTGTFRHTTADILDLSVAGQTKPIGTTPAHPFWSEDRQSFIPAGQLRPGERLRTAHGAITQVTQILPRPTPEPVYNLEVDVEHVYYVTTDGVLVHNSYGDKNDWDVGPHRSHDRRGRESHHGVNDHWMQRQYGHAGYNRGDAPTILMDQFDHHETRALEQTWKARMREQQGGTFDWDKVSEDDIRELAEAQLDAADVPDAIRDSYWSQFSDYMESLME